MKQSGLLRQHFKKKLYGGRGAAARALDFIALRAILYAACCLWFLSILQNTLLAQLLSLFTLLLLCAAIELCKSIAMDAFKKKEYRRMRLAYEQEQLLLLPPARFAQLAREYARETEAGTESFLIALQQKAPVSEDALLRIYRRAREQNSDGILLFSLSPLSPQAQAFRERAELCVRLPSSGELSAIAQKNGLSAGDELLTSLLVARLRRERAARKRNFSSPLLPGRANGYLWVALGLMAASFFVGYAAYYRLMAAVCLSLGVLSRFWSAGGAAAAGKHS